MDSSRLKREVHPIPPDILDRLTETGLMEAYEKRPPYQQNDYIGWIGRAKTKITREKRVSRMLEELRKGDSYMKMAYRAK